MNWPGGGREGGREGGMEGWRMEGRGKWEEERLKFN